MIAMYSGVLAIIVLFHPVLSALGDTSCPARSPCTTWRECPSYLEWRKLKKTDVDEYNRRFTEIKNSVCNQELRRVCCPESIDFSSPSWVPSAADRECGVSHSTAFIVGGDDTANGEMPWAALLGNNASGLLNWYCGGTLINAWYVVTAAHCQPRKVGVVRLGEWRVVDDRRPDANNQLVFSQQQRSGCRRRNRPCQNFVLVDSSRDCVDDEEEFVFSSQYPRADCGPPHQDFTVSRYLVHPAYRQLNSGVVINDIALVKLSRAARLHTQGQSNVSPICLPIPGTVAGSPADIGEAGSGLRTPYGVVVGWGKTYDGQDRKVAASVNSATQKKLKMPLLSNTECGDILSILFKVDLRSDIRKEHHLCGGGVLGEDSCNGDSGGPLIYQKDANSPFWLAGTVSFGTKTCGIGAPAVFTRIPSYIPWIRQNLT